MSNAKHLEGRCTRCWEWTTVHAPCCNASVYIDGRTVSPDDYCPDCGEELAPQCNCEACKEVVP